MVQIPSYLETRCIILGVLRLCNLPKNMIYLFSTWTWSCFSQVSLCPPVTAGLTMGPGRSCGAAEVCRMAVSVSVPPAGEGTDAGLAGAGTGVGLWRS